MTEGWLRFRLIGPFEMRIKDRALEIASPKQRTLLATLLLQVGSSLPAEEIAEAIWGKTQPSHPRKTVHTYVNRLRKRFSDQGMGPVIRSTASGYEVGVRPEQVDVWRFRHGLERAARFAQDGDLEGEAAALADTLRLWRGEPLAGVASELLQREIAPRLREQWLRAVDRQVEVELRLDRGEHLIGELFTLTARYPLRESLWINLITALDRSGRRSEALDAYHLARHHIVTDLGVEPGPELRASYAKTLGAVTPGAGGPVVSVPLVPRELPADVPTFVGREAELAQLDALCDGFEVAAGPMRIGVIAGMAGIGKTALAAHWARRVVDRFPDGQLWVNLRGFSPGQMVTPARALTRFLRTLGVQDPDIPLELDDQASLFRTLMAGRRMLVVLDNAYDTEQVRQLLPGSPGCLVVVTSRRQLSGLVPAEGVSRILPAVLRPQEARQLLARRLGPARVVMKDAATDGLVQACAGLPLALAIVAARAALHPGFGLDGLAAGLRDARGSLDAFAVSDPAVEMRAVFSWSYQSLGAPSARLFRMLGLHPGPDVALPAVASLAGLPVAEVRSLLAELCNANLVTEHEPGRYVCHDLLRSYAAELGRAIDRPAGRHDARLRMFDHYQRTAHAGGSVLYASEPVTPPPPRPLVTVEDFGDHRDVLRWFTAEHQVLLAMVQHAAEIGAHESSQQLVWAFSDYLLRRGHWHDCAQTLETALDAVVTRAERPVRARLHRELVRVYARMGRTDAAATHGRLALELAHDLGDRHGLAMTHRVLGLLCEVQGRFADALAHDLRTLELFQEVGNRQGEVRTLNSVGWSYARLNDFTTALEYCERALKLLTELDDSQALAATWDSLGYAHLGLGRHETAADCHGRAVRLYRDLGDRYKEAECLVHLGEVHEAAADPGAAKVAWEAALEIFDDLGHPYADRLRARL